MTNQSSLADFFTLPPVQIALAVAPHLPALIGALFKKGSLVIWLGISILGSFVIAIIAYFSGAAILYLFSILLFGFMGGVLLLTLAAGLHNLRITDVSNLIKDLMHSPVNPEAAKRLLALNTRVRSLPKHLQPLIANFADESTNQLVSPPGRLGEDISTDKYLNILKLSLKKDELCDVTFFQTVSPHKWGDPDARDTEVAKSAWEYFDIQERLKADSNDKIRMRRVLLVEQKVWKGDSSDENDPDVKQAIRFKEKHDKARISLWMVPPSSLKVSIKSVVQDMAMFYASDGCSWLIWSDVDDKKVEVGVFHAGMFYQRDGLPGKYQSFLRYILDQTHLSNQNPHHFLLSSKLPCNDPPVEFLASAGIE